MNAKDLYFGAIASFLRRNEKVFPQVQLQYGRNERWFAREMALAMNAHLNGSPPCPLLSQYADCEHKYVDIGVWKAGAKVAPWSREIVYEVKAMYSQRFSPAASTGRDDFKRVVARARQQLDQVNDKDARKVGLFWLVYNRRLEATPGENETLSVAADICAFQRDARQAIQEEFRSDHEVRLTELCPETRISFGLSGGASGQRWSTASWITWGTLRNPPASTPLKPPS